MMSKYIKVIPTVLGSICIIVLLILGLQNCNPYVSNSINDGHSVLNPSNLTTNSVYKSFYANWVNSVEDINCANMANINLTDAEFQYIKNSESQFSHNRYMIIHPQPVDFTGNLSHFQEISSQFANVGTSFKPATSMTYFAFEERDLCAFKKKIKKAFKYSVEYNLPLLIHIDFEWFIDNRLDIWNWYLPSQEGYNVNNKFKVEWSNWNTPIKKFGIFWDEAGLPRKARLCYSNPSVQLEVVQKGRFIASIINEWRLELAKMNKSYLFVGIDPGWETGIQNYSNYAPAKNIGVNYNMGYCALHYEGYSEKNPPADPEAALIEVVRKYVDLESQIFFEKGIPKNKIFTHIAAMGGDKVLGVHPNAPFHQRSPIELAFNDYSTPGLSLYPNVYFTDSIINKVKGHDWSIIETAYSNFEHLSVFAGDPNLKSINIYSWDLIKREGQIPNVINLMNFPINYGAIEGWIDGVSLSNGKHYLSGWACSKGYGQAVGLHVYANGPHPNGTVLTTSEKTNISAEQGIASVCLLGPGKPLRFSIEIPSHIKQNYGGQSIFIYGIHPSGVGSQNKLLGNSGNLKIPNL